MDRLVGRIAVVTGGASGMGRATAHTAARNGAAVAVLDFDEAGAATLAADIEAEGGKAIGQAVDVADPLSVEHAFDSITSKLGSPDAGFNFAGIWEVSAIAETPLDVYERIMGVNVRGVWLCSQQIIRRALASGGPATIVNIASVNAFCAEPQSAAYCASKGAVYALTRAIAFDHAKDNIRVNCICPGTVETGMTAAFLEGDNRSHVAQQHALGRFGQPDEIAAVAVFLASEDASFIHGAAIVVDGGMTIGVK